VKLSIQSSAAWRAALKIKLSHLGISSAGSQRSLWLIAAIVFTVLMGLNSADALKPANRWLYDHAIEVNKNWGLSTDAQMREVMAQEAPLLIAIDESSLKSLGRWPWPRSYHAELIKRLSADQQQPKLVAFDIVFAEPHTQGVTGEENDDDALLAKAIQDSTFPVILAAQVSESDGRQQFIKPHEPLASSGARLAHIHIDTDTDGAVRRYIPIDYDMGGLALPYMGKSMLFPYSASKANAIRQSAAPSGVLTKRLAATEDQNRTLAFHPMSDQWIRSVPYAKVLSGEIPASYWDNKRVLIASTAKGLGDQYVTPIYSPSTIVSGGELILSALHTELLLQAGQAPLVDAHWLVQWASLAATLLLILFVLRRLVRFSAQLGVVLLALLVLATVVLASLSQWGVWTNPAQHVLAILLTWLFWLSYRLNRVLGFLLERVQSQQAIAPSLVKTAQAPLVAASKPLGDALEERLKFAQAADSIRQSEYALLNEVLELLPDAAFVLNSDLKGGLVQGLQNYAARQLAQRLPSVQAAMSKPYLDMNALLASFRPDLTQSQLERVRSINITSPSAPAPVFDWQALLHLSAHPAFDQGVEADLSGDERYLVNVRRMLTRHGDPASERYVLTLVNLSVTQALSREREQTLNFLSHDLRSPQAAIIAMLDLETVDHPDLKAVFLKIQAQAQRTLDLAEGFVQWSRATHAHTYQLDPYDLNDLVIEAIDELWANAKQQGVRLDSQLQAGELMALIDRSLMWRAVVNVLRNALNVSGPGDTITISASAEGSLAIIAIEDQGPGIPLELQMQVFEPFLQGGGLNRKGAGLGLAFVQSVLREHGGQVMLQSPSPLADGVSKAAPGTRFELRVPRTVD
jgi:signal transduction histidine kinase/CHASE2 domain-containing sensor protein